MISKNHPKPAGLAVPGEAMSEPAPSKCALFRRRWLAALLCVAGATQAMAAPLELPALTVPASQEHHVGKVIFVELVTPDIAAAKRFYGGLFGWTFRDIQTGPVRYADAFLDGRSVAGLVQKDMPAGARSQQAPYSLDAAGPRSARGSGGGRS